MNIFDYLDRIQVRLYRAWVHDELQVAPSDWQALSR